MRLVQSFLLLLVSVPAALAQPDIPAEPHTLPAWMQDVALGKKPVAYTLPKREPLHTNAFTGTWSVQKEGGRRFDFWSDKHRVVIKEVDERRSLERFIFLDLAANIRMNAHVDKGQALFIVEDLHVPNVGYFREIWSTTVEPTGRTETILGAPCKELLGIDANNDTTYYWRTDQHPKLFADMEVWAPWLCREGELEFLTALCDKPAGGCLRVQWPKRRFGPQAGSISVLAITPGASPMPTITAGTRFVAERRFLWNNSSGIGTLPAWMRAYVSDLKPDSLPAAYTPAPVNRNIPDNKFIGTFTAETPTMILGMRDEKTGRDTTHRLSKYSYWADARRAVLIMDDPEDEGYLFYAVDLDADVVMASHNEMSGHVIPKLYISTLEEVGLKEFGRGLELNFTPRGHSKTMLGRECELYTTDERFLSHFWFPKKDVVNPVFDMKNWMVQRMGQKMKEVMFFGVADKPMPMAVMGTHLTSYKLGKAKPPVADLRYYRVKDERLERRRRREEYDVPEVRNINVEEMMRGEGMMDVAVPEPAVMDEPMMLPDPPKPPTEFSGSGTGRSSADIGVYKLGPTIDSLMKANDNRFIGTAKLHFSSTLDDKTVSWTVQYASTLDRIVIIGQDEQKDHTEHTYASVIDRRSATEINYVMVGDSLRTRKHHLDRRFRSPYAPVTRDSVVTGTRKLVGRTAQHRLFESPESRRESWVDVGTPSLFHDVLGARKSWGGVEVLLRGPMIASTRLGMPLEVTYTYKSEEKMVMKVLELKPGPVDPKVFEITKASFKK